MQTNRTYIEGEAVDTPEILTERLVLRRFTMEDSDAFLCIMRDKEVNTYLPMFPLDTAAEAKAYLKEHYLSAYENQAGFRYAICLRSDHIPIGYVNVGDDESCDFGYGLAKVHWHQGIVTEACTAVIDQIKKSDIPYLTATHDIQNPRSGHVMKKIGMTYRYTYEEQWQPKDILVTFRMYQINLDGRRERTYRKYWDRYHVHYVEENIE
ncbi:MAG: GNAT family N-acetyltransferase [Clostridiales bacterium]|nr:GNAT family N-acetyltransferase [Clostridiales bacterium]